MRSRAESTASRPESTAKKIARPIPKMTATWTTKISGLRRGRPRPVAVDIGVVRNCGVGGTFGVASGAGVAGFTVAPGAPGEPQPRAPRPAPVF